jgi:acyl-CoA synthetase (AMP-forming)/AMP-acid ligase II
MLGKMMDRPLLISSLIRHAAQYHGGAELVSRTIEGGTHRYTYRDAERRGKQLAQALQRLGVALGDRIGTVAWNGYRHYELYFGVAGIGAVCHTINPRLFVEQIRYIVNHAEDRVLFVDLTFVPLIEELAGDFHAVRHYVIMTDRTHMPVTSLPNVLCYEDLLAAETADFEWPEFDHKTASSLCYTSGTTGNPKGVLYSHYSTVLHSFTACMADTIGYSARDVVCPVAPMFHANAWGSPYAVTMVGAKLVLPGRHVDGASLHTLFEEEAITIAIGVPTVWLGLLNHITEAGKRFTTLKRTLIGGSAVPLSMMKAFEGLGIEALQGWGMTEMSPLGTICTLTPEVAALPPEQQDAFRIKQGHGIYGVDLKLVDAEGKVQPHDGQSSGELLVRGPWITSGYFNDERANAAAFDDEGWFRTGDVATIDALGYMQIVDRSKDVIKSGGEWISSIDVENAAMGHPDVAEAAVIGVPHPKWDERPLLVVVPRAGRQPTARDLIAFLADKIAKWQLPDDVVLVGELPHTATGKVLKIKLREMFRDHNLPSA